MSLLTLTLLLSIAMSCLQGQLLAVSPYESHLDERLFGPHAFDYDPCRGDLAAVLGVAGIGGVAGFAFGGGRYRYISLFIPSCSHLLEW